MADDYFVAGVAAEVLNSAGGSNSQTATVAVEVLNNSDGSSAQTATFALEVLLTVAPARTRAFDGAQIYAIDFAFQPETIFSESDWDSIYSIGSRLQSGLLTASAGGWGVPGNPTEIVDDNYGFTGANGFTGAGPGGNVTPVGAYLEITTADDSFQIVTGFRLMWSGGNRFNPGYYEFWGGYDGVPWIKNTLEFDQFAINLAGTGPHSGQQMQLTFTPFLLPFNSFFFILATATTDSDGHAFFDEAVFGSELELKCYHSILDGGDRRASNGRPAKRVSMTSSSGITIGAVNLDTVFDGQYALQNGGGFSKTDSLDFLGTSGGTHQVTTPGEYIQFAFPRQVGMRDIVFNTNIGEMVDGGGAPTRWGVWQWMGSNASSSGFVAVGSPWQFTAGGFMRGPPPIDYIDPVNRATKLFTYWRMVLVTGPMGGTSDPVFQIMFNLIDPNDQVVPWEISFSDDVDGLLPTITNQTGGSPSQVSYTDGDSDVLNATLTVRNNPLLSAAFTDAAGDGLQAWGSFYPSTVVQSITIVKGR